MFPTHRVQCQYPYADTQQHDPRIVRSPDDRHNHPHRMTPEDTTNADTTNRQQTDDTTPEGTTPDGTGRSETDRPSTDSSPRPIPGRTPITEEAGAPIVPMFPAATDATNDPLATTFEKAQRPTRPPTTEEQDAPLVPDLRPTRRAATDGGAR